MDKTVIQLLRTAEPWDKVNEAMREYEEYGERVQSYVLFLMGGMSGLSQYEIQKCFEEAPKKIEELKKKNMYLSSRMLELIYSDKAGEHELDEIYRKSMVINVNVISWLDAASIYVCDSMDTSMVISSSREVITELVNFIDILLNEFF